MIVKDPGTTGDARAGDLRRALGSAMGGTCGLRTPLTGGVPCRGVIDGDSFLLDRGEGDPLITCGKCLPDCFEVTGDTVLIQLGN